MRLRDNTPVIALAGAVALAIAVALSGLAMAYFGDVGSARRALPQLAAAVCDDPTDCSRKDLPAQVRVAVATEVLVDISLVQLIVSIVGTAAIGATLILSVVATRAATRAAEIAEDTAHRELRAYVIIDMRSMNIEYRPSPIQGHLRVVASVDAVFINHGTTPAFDVEFGGTIRPIPWPIGPTDHATGPAASGYRSVAPLVRDGNGQQTFWEEFDFDPTTLLAGTSKIYIAAFLKYETFGVRRRTNIHYIVDGPTLTQIATQQALPKDLMVAQLSELCEMT